MLAVIEEPDDYTEVTLVSIPEKCMGYVEIELNVVDNDSFLVPAIEFERCGENLMGFYCTDDDKHRWLIGQDDELDGVMHLADTAVALHQELVGNGWDYDKE